MTAAIDRELTERQRAVLERIDRRLPLKAVAAELGISESRVNQHVRGLKERYGVHSLPDLLDAWRSAERPIFFGASADQGDSDPCINSAWRNAQVPDAADRGEERNRVVPGEFVLSDAALFAIEAPWSREDEPRVVPGALDGDNAILFRLAVITGLAFGLVAAIVLVVTASLSMSEALEGKAAVTPTRDASAG